MEEQQSYEIRLEAGTQPEAENNSTEHIAHLEADIAELQQRLAKAEAERDKYDKWWCQERDLTTQLKRALKSVLACIEPLTSDI